MRCPEALCALLLGTVAACFVDTGDASSGKDAGSASGDGASTGDVSASATWTSGDSGSTSGSTTSTSGDATSFTSGATSFTSGDATTATTSTTGPLTTSGEPGCEGECTPGTVEIGGGCGSCGEEQRTCTDQCTWGGWTCVDAPDSCGFWYLPTGSQTWEHYPIEAKGGAFAPVAPIQAAFDVKGRDEGWVLTGTTYHVLNLQTLKWTRMGLRADFVNLGGSPVRAAYSTNDGEGGQDPDGNDSVTLLTATSAALYDVSLATGQVKFVDKFACCADQWNTPASPAIADVRAIWLDLQNVEEWLSIPVGDCGNLPPDSPIDWYMAAITDSRVHISEIGSCFEFKESTPFKNYPPFGYEGAPSDPTQIGAAFYADGLWIFKGI